ncbi:MAG: aa3-type cytochrome oxidase subunit IV [Acidimicrobiia bacterium]
MKVASVVMGGLGLFLVPFTAWYGLAAAEHGGFTALVATVLALVFLGAYLYRLAKQVGDRPEDRDATPPEGAGEVGVFPARSPWPAILGVGAALIGFFLVFSRWLAVPGLALLVIGGAGLAAESQRGRGHAGG